MRHIEYPVQHVGIYQNIHHSYRSRSSRSPGDLTFDFWITGRGGVPQLFAEQDGGIAIFAQGQLNIIPTSRSRKLRLGEDH